MLKQKTWLLALISLVSYALIAVAYFGWPVLAHPYHYFVGDGADTSLFMWMLNWWPFALSHHINPFYTNYVWYPQGYSIANATAVPFYALLFWPITTHFGAQISYNLLAIFLSAVNAWAMYGFAWFLTKRFSAAWVGGFIFGFSTYVIAQTMNGHLNLISLYALPLLGWTLCAFCQEKVRTWVTLLLLIAIFSLSFGTSREIFAIIWVIGTCTAFLALYYFKHYRNQILKSYGLCIIANAVTLCIYWPYFWAFIHYAHTTRTGAAWSTEGFFWNSILPTRISLANLLLPEGLISKLSTQPLATLTNYMGLFIIVLLLFWLKKAFKSATRAFLVWGWFIGFIASLGPFILITDHLFSHIFSPTFLLAYLPFVDKIIAPRFTLCAWFFLSLIVAMWIKQSTLSPWKKALIIILSMISILPSFSHQKRTWYQTTLPLQFFQQHRYEHYCQPNPHVWILTAAPWLGQSVRWQIASGMAFKQYYGYVNYFPPLGYPHYNLAQYTIQRTFTLEDAEHLKQFIAQQGISCLITDPTTIKARPFLFSDLPKPAYAGEGVVVFHFPPRYYVQ